MTTVGTSETSLRHAKKRVTLADVARMADVSVAVVSYVINDGPRATSAEARRRVLGAVEALSYHPNAAARGLRMQRTHTVGFVSYDYYPQSAFFAPYNAGVLTGLTFALREKRYYLLPSPLGIDEELDDFRELLHSGRLDGVVIRLAQEPPVTDAVLEIIAQAGVPCVCIERAGGAHFGFSSVTYDDEGAAHAATNHLIELGHRRIAHIKGDLRQVAARARLAGYRRALAEANLPIVEDFVECGSWLSEDAAAATYRLMALDTPPTAVFAANDRTGTERDRGAASHEISRAGRRRSGRLRRRAPCARADTGADDRAHTIHRAWTSRRRLAAPRDDARFDRVHRGDDLARAYQAWNDIARTCPWSTHVAEVVACQHEPGACSWRPARRPVKQAGQC